MHVNTKFFLYEKPGSWSIYSIKNIDISSYLHPDESVLFAHSYTNNKAIVTIFPRLLVKYDDISNSDGKDNHMSRNYTDLDVSKCGM